LGRKIEGAVSAGGHVDLAGIDDLRPVEQKRVQIAIEDVSAGDLQVFHVGGDVKRDRAAAIGDAGAFGCAGNSVAPVTGMVPSAVSIGPGSERSG